MYWREALVIVKPETFIRWHRKGFNMYWRWKSRGGRPRLPREVPDLIVRMVKENATWGEERVAAELSVKLGIWSASKWLPGLIGDVTPRQPRQNRAGIA
jgi:putative transposase